MSEMGSDMRLAACFESELEEAAYSIFFSMESADCRVLDLENFE